MHVVRVEAMYSEMVIVTRYRVLLIVRVREVFSRRMYWRIMEYLSIHLRISVVMMEC